MRRMVQRILWSAVVFLLVTGPVSYGKVIYVDDDAPAGGDGRSWATAYRFLWDALVIWEKPVEIHVAQGLYKPDRSRFAPEGLNEDDAVFELFDDMSLLGGYAGLGADDPNARDFEVYETVLSGDLAGDDAEVTDPTLLRDDPTRRENTWVVVKIKGHRVLVEGVTITGAVCSGVHASRGTSETIVRECRFHGNRGDEGDANLSGGALTSHSDGLLVVRCSFVGNTGLCVGPMGVSRIAASPGTMAGDPPGGAGRLWDEGGTFTDCTFVDNRAEGNGGALHFSRGEGKLSHCIFRGNVAGRGGGGLGLCWACNHHRLRIRRK